MEIFHQDVFWKELLIEKRECNEKMLNLRRKRVAGEREDEVLVMKKKLQEIVECLKGCEELLREDEEFNFEGRMKEWLKKSGEKEKEEKKEVVVVGGEEQDDFLKALKNLSLSSSSASSLPTDLTLKKIDALIKLRLLVTKTSRNRKKKENRGKIDSHQARLLQRKESQWNIYYDVSIKNPHPNSLISINCVFSHK